LRQKLVDRKIANVVIRILNSKATDVNVGVLASEVKLNLEVEFPKDLVIWIVTSSV